MHADPDLLALLALGESVGTDDDRAHLQTCGECAGELAELHRLVTLGRSSAAEVGLTSPSADVWARIREELALGADAGSSVLTGDSLRAHAQLTPVEKVWSLASGTAELATDAQGRRLLQVSLHADLPTEGFRQAWLVHRDDPSRRQSLGIFDGPHGLWTVDHKLDLEQYSVLDISQQGLGDTEHSGETIVRGQLALAS